MKHLKHATTSVKPGAHVASEIEVHLRWCLFDQPSSTWRKRDFWIGPVYSNDQQYDSGIFIIAKKWQRHLSLTKQATGGLANEQQSDIKNLGRPQLQYMTSMHLHVHVVSSKAWEKILFLLYTKSCTQAKKTTVSDKNKRDTSCCVADTLCSKRFRRAKSEEQGFWCFVHVKNGMRAKIGRGGGRGEWEKRLQTGWASQTLLTCVDQRS